MPRFAGLTLPVTFWLAGIGVGLPGTSGRAAAEAPQVPIAVLWVPDGRVHVALRDARGLVSYDPATWSVTRRLALDFRPASLGLAADRFAILVGGQDGEVAVVRDGAVRRLGPAGKGPTRVLGLADGSVAAGSLWDDAVRVIDGETGAVSARHPLGFSPGVMLALPDGRLVVADAFGGKLAVLKPGQPGPVRVRTFDGFNLHGLALTPEGDELLVTHLSQYGEMPISSSNIDWGLILSARLSGVLLSEFDADRPEGSEIEGRRLTLDGSGNGAADPAAVAVSPDGSRIVVALAGAHQLMINDRSLAATRRTIAGARPPLGDSQLLQTIAVGQNPVDLALSPDGTLAVTADAMADTLSVVKLDDLSLVRTVELGSGPPSRDASARGEALFRDGRRSMDRWMSCASCHTGGHTNGLNFDTQGDGGSGAAKNTPSLLGVGQTAPYTWVGRMPSLAVQVHQSFLTSLRGRAPEESMSEDVAAYLSSLAPPPPRRDPADSAAIRGAAVFSASGCDSCHAPPTFTRPIVRDVGLNDGAGGNDRFNPPSLRGVARTAPYLHDGRAPTLEAVLEIHQPGLEAPLDRTDRSDLIAFLESL